MLNFLKSHGDSVISYTAGCAAIVAPTWDWLVQTAGEASIVVGFIIVLGRAVWDYAGYLGLRKRRKK